MQPDDVHRACADMGPANNLVCYGPRASIEIGRKNLLDCTAGTMDNGRKDLWSPASHCEVSSRIIYKNYRQRSVTGFLV